MVGFFYGEFLRIKGTDLNFRNPHIINGGRNKIDFWILRGGLSPVFSQVMMVFWSIFYSYVKYMLNAHKYKYKGGRRARYSRRGDARYTLARQPHI